MDAMTLALQARTGTTDGEWFWLTGIVAGLLAALAIGWVVVRRVLLDGGSRK